MTSYAALIHKEEGTDYGVTFPDFPGCVTAGATLDEALDLAHEALAFHVEGLRADGTPIPAPRSLAAIRAAAEDGQEDWIDFTGASVALVSLA